MNSDDTDAQWGIDEHRHPGVDTVQLIDQVRNPASVIEVGMGEKQVVAVSFSDRMGQSIVIGRFNIVCFLNYV